MDRENLLEKQHAKLIVRANLYLNEEMESLKQLSSPYITLTMKTLDGRETTQVFHEALNDDKDLELEFVGMFFFHLFFFLHGSVPHSPLCVERIDMQFECLLPRYCFGMFPKVSFEWN